MLQITAWTSIRRGIIRRLFSRYTSVSPVNSSIAIKYKEQLDDHIVKPKINDYNIFSDPVLYWSLSLKVVVI